MTTSSDANLPTLLTIELDALKYCLEKRQDGADMTLTGKSFHGRGIQLSRQKTDV